MIIVADTSGLIAASDKNAAECAGCQAVLAGAGTVVVSPLVLTEVDHLAAARFGNEARTSLIDFILFQARRDRFLLPQVTIDLLETARKVQRKYAALNLDLADAVNVALAAEYRTDSLLTLDRRDFRAISPLTPHPAFRLLPDDMEHLQSLKGQGLAARAAWLSQRCAAIRSSMNAGSSDACHAHSPCGSVAHSRSLPSRWRQESPSAVVWGIVAEQVDELRTAVNTAVASDIGRWAVADGAPWPGSRLAPRPRQSQGYLTDNGP